MSEDKRESIKMTIEVDSSITDTEDVKIKVTLVAKNLEGLDKLQDPDNPREVVANITSGPLQKKVLNCLSDITEASLRSRILEEFQDSMKSFLEDLED